MKIIILAAGEGKRMWPIQQDKCLIPFLGKPLLHYTLAQVKENTAADEYILVANPQNKDQVSKIASDLGINFKIAIQEKPKGMADSILSAKQYIDGEVLVINAEDVLEGGIYQEVANAGGDVVFAGVQVNEYFPGGYLKVGGDKIEGIVEKPGKGNESSNLVKLVVDYFQDGKKLVEYLQKSVSEKDDAYEIALDKMIKEGMDIKFIKYNGVWIPLKYPWQILDISAYLLLNCKQQISPSAKVSDKAIIEGNVVIEDGARVFEGAVIKGPVYIGKNVIVGNNSMIRESDLEEECVTGFNSDITRSYIGPNSWFHTNYIGDSVIEGDFGMGSGAVLANLRLDDHTIRVGQEKIDSGKHKLGLIAGRGSRVGVNASTMPGARIGSNSLIGPGVVLYGDIKENTKAIVKQELEETEHTPVLTSYDQFRNKI